MTNVGYPPPQSNSGTQSTLALTSPNLSKLESPPSPELDTNRHVTRTPSPTPSEAKELGREGVFEWKRLASWRFWFRREWLWYYVALIIICVVFALMTVYHQEITDWLRPAAEWLHDLQFGWLVPIGILFVLSFPPLFGQEIVGVLCGLIWGLGVGFAIVSAGTLLGEIGNYYAFKYLCRARSEKWERDNIQYGCLAKVVRDGGFWIALVARFSAIPGHFTTAVFATCGMGIIVFTIAAILSMPKQFITVYLGVILERSRTGEEQSTTSKIISNVALALTAVVTIAAMWYIYHRMNKVKVEVIRLRRKRRQGKLQRSSTMEMTGSFVYPSQNNPFSSESTLRLASQTDIPLKTAHSPPYDARVSGPHIQAPKPLAYDQHGYESAYFQSYDSPSDERDDSSVGHDLYSSKPYAPVDSYDRAQYTPSSPPRPSTSSSRQPISANATYYSSPSSVPPSVRAERPMSPPNFSRARSPPSALEPQVTSYPPYSSSSDPTDIPLANAPFQAHRPLTPPHDPEPSLLPYSEHQRDTTDATFVTAREPSTYEPPMAQTGGRHHQMETSEGPRPSGYF